MRPWSTDHPPTQDDAPPRRDTRTSAPGQRGAFPQPPAGDVPASWRSTSRPFDRSAPMPMTPPAPQPAPAPEVLEPSDMLTLAGIDVTKPLIRGRFGSATGMNLKVRFLLALTLLTLAPAFLLVLLYQQANQNSLSDAGQQALASAAQADSTVLTRVLTNRQAYLAQLAGQSSIAGVSRGAGSQQQAEDLLNSARLSTPDALAWVVLSGSDQIVAASPPTSLGHSLQSPSAILTDPSDLVKFVQKERAAPAPKAGQTPLLIATGIDKGPADKVWVATLAFVTPTSPAQSGIVLAVFALPALVNTYWSALPADPKSYAGLFDLSGTILGVTGNEQLAKQVGQTLAIAPLRSAVQAMQAGQETTALSYQDQTTGANEVVSGYMSKDLHMVILVVASPETLAPVTTGLLQGRNLPLIFLLLFVVTSLIATWVALPIVRPIRRATREILASTDDVRLLALQAKQIAKDQRLGTDILEGAAKGLDMRRRAIGRDAGLIANSSTVAATRLAQLAHATNELPVSSQAPVQTMVRELYLELQTVHQLATGIATGLESDPVQKRLGNVMEGAAEISQQFDQASQQLDRGAQRLEHAAETLQ